MHNSTLLNNHSHNGITVDLPSLFMYPHNLVYPDVAHKVAGDKDEIIGDDTVSIDITEGVPWCERLPGSNDWHNLETRSRFRPLGLPIADGGRFQRCEMTRPRTHFIAALTRFGCDLHTTKISCTPAKARLSSVQSSKGALHIGNKH